MTRKGAPREGSASLSRILGVLRPGMRLLDIGCGQGRLIQELAQRQKGVSLWGLDNSRSMIEIAGINTMALHNVILLEGDGRNLPTADCTFDVVTTRLAKYSQREAFRVLKKGGYFFAYGLGPDANKEIREFFPKRIQRENFFAGSGVKDWKRALCHSLRNKGFVACTVEDYKDKQYYRNEAEVMDLIEMVPLVRDFTREEDKDIVSDLVARYSDNIGIPITWHYYVAQARRP